MVGNALTRGCGRIQIISTMARIIHLLLWGALICGCAVSPKYSHSFINRLIDSKFDSGCVVFPIGNNRFKIEQNSLVRGRLYYDYNREAYNDYGVFLYNLLNQSQAVSIPLVFKNDSFTCNKDIEKMAKRDFVHFGLCYLDKIDTNSYRVKSDYRGLEKQILKACFDNGFYIYYSCLDGSYTVCVTPNKQPLLY